MPFEAMPAAGRRIAVVGAGISGMGAADMLARNHQVTLFEAERRLGGHARTRSAGPRREDLVDTGFIVFNRENYPFLSGLFDELGVETVPSNMSFGASIGGGRLEYALSSMSALFAQRRNLLNPRFLWMLRDILRFNARAISKADDPSMTVAGLLKVLGTGRYFRDYYLLPFTGAIWSTPKEQILEFPAKAMIDFMRNHAIINVHGQHQWYTVRGGSRAYVRKLGARLLDRGVDLRLGAAVAGVRRSALGVEVRAWGGEWEVFDDIVFATHSDDSLRMLADPSGIEREMLGAVRYQPNNVILHSDAGVMPRSRQVWSSWVYTEAQDKRTEQIDVTYWMNSLQPWLKGRNYFVTLNSTKDIREELIWDEVEMRHPVYDLGALAAQETVRAMNGANNTWYCGAWVKHGFHEDGLSSARDVVTGMATRAAMSVAAE